MSFISSRLTRAKPSPTIAVSRKADELKRNGLDIIVLGAGEPDFNTPDFIKEAAIKAIHENKTKYTVVDGAYELKDAIIRKFKRDNNLEYERKNITVGTGAKQVLFNAFMATLDPGDEVIIPAPYWVSYPDMVEIAEGTNVFVECLEENGFKITAKELGSAITDKTKWLMLNSPSNPSGMLYTKEELKDIASVLHKHPQVHVMCDDIYEHIIFAGEQFFTLATVAPELKDRIFVVNGVSKSYSMTGWRIGYGAGSEQLIKAISVIQSQSTSGPCSISQYASIAALDGPQDFQQEFRDSFQKRRDFAVKCINEMPGLACLNPGGAFYLFPSCKGLLGKKTSDGKVISNDTDFASYLLEKFLVAVVPGIGFGTKDHFRISYACGMDSLKIAMDRMHKACSELIG